MENKELKYFAGNDGKLNADDASFVIGLNEWVNAENIRTGSTDAGVTGTVESIGSNVLISTPQPSIVFTTIGTVADIENERFIKFQYCNNAPFHKIVCCYTHTHICMYIYIHFAG